MADGVAATKPGAAIDRRHAPRAAAARANLNVPKAGAGENQPSVQFSIVRNGKFTVVTNNSYDWHRQGCGAGYGTRGGTSRGEGSGSRYLKVVCQHPGCGYQVRVTRKWLALGTPQCPIADH